jgi:hypothetical protein
MELQGLRPAYTMSGEETLAALDALHAKIAALETYQLELMVRLDDTGYPKEIGAHDTARLIATRHRKNLGAVRRDLALAKALPKYPAVASALPNPHASTGAHADTSDDPGAPGVADRRTEVGAEGLLPVVVHPAQAQAIVAALEAIPSTAMVEVEDLQVAEEQMVEAARHLPPWELTRLGKQVRNLLDTDGPEPAEEAAARREAFWLKNADQGVKFGGYLSSERAALLRTLIEPAAKPRKTPEGEPDPRSREKRQADRFSDVLHLAAATGELPSNGGVKPHITVTMDLADLIAAGQDATGDLQFGESLSAGAVRRLACDAEVIPIVLGADSEPLDVGRAKRLITPAMRKALNLRDKGCVVCGAAPIYCDAHHIVSWLNGGTTSIDNLALFCRAHHTDVDNGHYTVTIINGVVHLTRPTWADPPPRGAPPAAPATNHSTPHRASANEIATDDASVTAAYWAAKTTPRPSYNQSHAEPNPAANPTVAPADESSEGEEAVGKVLRPIRAFPMAGDPPPLVAPPDFDPWGSEVLDRKADGPSLVPAPDFDPWGSEVPDRKLGDSPPVVADAGFDPWGPEVLDTG